MDFKMIKEKMRFVPKREVIGIAIFIVLGVLGSVYYSLSSIGVFDSFSIQNSDSFDDVVQKSEVSEKSEESGELEDSEKSGNLDKQDKIKVYVTGEVNKPGVIELFEGERIKDAIDACDGVTNNANLEDVNLAYRLEDGQKVFIPNINDKEKQEIVSKENGEGVIEGSIENKSYGKVNINSAGVDKLCEVPGVGKALAQRIISYREQNGKFNNIEELKNVSGIGEKKFEGLKEFVVVK